VFDLSELPSPLIRYGAGVWRRRWLIVVIAWMTALLGWAAIWFLPNQYVSQAQVLIQEPVRNDRAANPNFERRVDILRLSLLTFPNVEEIIYRAGLDEEIEAVSPSDRQAQLEGLVMGVTDGIRIESPKDTYFIITFSHSDAEIARNVVEAAVNLLIEQDLGTRLRDTETQEQKLNKSISEFDSLLARQERAIAEYRLRYADDLASSLGDEQARDRRRDQLENIEDRISEARIRVETLRARLSVTPKTTTGGELEALKIRLAQLRSQYNDNYPDIQNLIQQIAQLEASESLPDNPDYQRIASEFQTARDTLRALEVREEDLRTQIEAEQVTFSQAPEVVLELQRMERNLKETRDTHQSLLAKRDALFVRKTLDDGGTALDYDVLEPPRKPLIPTSPPRLILIVGATIAAFGAGGLLALVLTFIERTYTQSSDLEQAFGLPVLGAIGRVSTPASRRKARFDVLRLFGACAALFLLAAVYIYLAVLHPQAVILEGKPDGVVATLRK